MWPRRKRFKPLYTDDPHDIGCWFVLIWFVLMIGFYVFNQYF